MSKPPATTEGSGIAISDVYGNWRPTQAWLAEVTRTTATRMFAQASLWGNESAVEFPVAVHGGALTAQVHRLFGPLFDKDAPHFSVPRLIDLLVRLDDLGHIGNGYYVPRESRVVRLAEGWGRIAGGLPLELSEHPEGGIESPACESLGRIARLACDFAPYDQGTEYSEVFRWGDKSVDKLFCDLCERLPERVASAPPEENTVYYNSQHHRDRNRASRWQSRLSSGLFVVARTGSQPVH